MNDPHTKTETVWWLDDGTEHCVLCSLYYVHGRGVRCAHCDREICPECVVVIWPERRAVCIECQRNL